MIFSSGLACEGLWSAVQQYSAATNHSASWRRVHVHTLRALRLIAAPGETRLIAPPGDFAQVARTRA